jgi:hypothetical protein
MIVPAPARKINGRCAARDSRGAGI